jgi:hypothetical protein
VSTFSRWLEHDARAASLREGMRGGGIKQKSKAQRSRGINKIK